MPTTIPVWQTIINKYSPALIGECEKAVTWSNEMTDEWLRTGMFHSDDSSPDKIDIIIQELGDHALTKSHQRHLSADRCREIGLRVVRLEADQKLQDAALSLHHACMLRFSATPAFKMIENQNGTAFIKLTQQVLVPGQPAVNQEMMQGLEQVREN